MAISVAGTVHTLPFSNLQILSNRRRSFSRIHDDDTIFLVKTRSHWNRFQQRRVQNNHNIRLVNRTMNSNRFSAYSRKSRNRRSHSFRPKLRERLNVLTLTNSRSSQQFTRSPSALPASTMPPELQEFLQLTPNSPWFLK